MDFGFITEKSDLPVTAVYLNDLSQAGQRGVLGVGNLQCAKLPFGTEPSCQEWADRGYKDSYTYRIDPDGPKAEKGSFFLMNYNCVQLHVCIIIIYVLQCVLVQSISFMKDLNIMDFQQRIFIDVSLLSYMHCLTLAITGFNIFLRANYELKIKKL